MPTAFNRATLEGEPQTFREFALHTATWMAMFHGLDGDPLPEEFTARPFYQETVDKAEAALDAALSMTDEEWQQATTEHYDRVERQREEELQRTQVERGRIEARMAEVNAWQPPTPDHEPFKRVMLEQLQMALDIDCNTSYCEQPVVRLNWEEFKVQRLQQLDRDVDYWRQQLDEATENARLKTEWVRALRDSLPEAEPANA